MLSCKTIWRHNATNSQRLTLIILVLYELVHECIMGTGTDNTPVVLRKAYRHAFKHIFLMLCNGKHAGKILQWQMQVGQSKKIFRPKTSLISTINLRFRGFECILKTIYFLIRADTFDPLLLLRVATNIQIIRIINFRKPFKNF